MPEVTDPKLLEQLNAKPKEVTDPDLLYRLGRKSTFSRYNPDPQLLSPEEKKGMADSANKGADILGGIAEQPAAGLGAIGEMAYRGVTSGWKGFLNVLRTGQDFTKAFEEEYMKSAQGTNPVNFVFESLQPQTDAGKAIFHKIGDWIDTALSAVGDQAFKNGILSPLGPAYRALHLFDSPESRAVQGAAAKGIATVGTIVGPAKLAKDVGEAVRAKGLENFHKQMDADLQRNPPEFMQKYYPKTWEKMQAGSTGKVMPGVELGVEQKVMASVRNQLESLGASQDITPGMSLGEMMGLVIERSDVNKEISPGARQAIVDAFVERINELKKVEDAMKPKALPAPSPVEGTIEVTPSGKAATPTQRVEGYSVFQQLTNEQRAEVLGIGPMGILRTKVDSLNAAKRGAGEGRTTGAVDTAFADTLKAWRKAFPAKKGFAKKRDEVFNQWLEQGAPYVPWETIDGQIHLKDLPPAKAQALPKEAKKGKGKAGKQAGTIDLDGLEQNVTSLREAFPYLKFASLTTHAGNEVQYNKLIALHEVKNPTLKLVGNSKVYEIFDPKAMKETGKKEVLGYVELTKDANGEFTTLHNIYGSGRPATGRSWGGEKVIASLLASKTPKSSLIIKSIVPGAEEFWKKMGVENFQGTRDGYINADNYLAVRDQQTKPSVAPKSQRGTIDLGGLEKLPEEAKKAAEALRVTAAVPKGGDPSGFNKVERTFNESIKATEEANKRGWKDVANAFRDKVADHQGTLKRVLIDKGGKLGEEVVDRLNIINGATMRGKYIYDTEARPIFDGLSRDDLIQLSKLMRARTAVEISRRNPKYKHTGGLTQADFEGWVRTFAKSEPERFNLLDRRADQAFALYRSQLDALLENGLISKESYNRLISFDYSPTEYVKLIDPTEDFYIHGQKITVTNSGVPYLKGGHTGAVVLDARKLLAEHITRVQNRIMRNDSVAALHKLAEANPDLGFLKVIPVKEWNKQGYAMGVNIPPDMMKLTYMKEGKQQVLAIDADLGKEWVFRPPAMDSVVADIFRLASGTSVVKALATSYNPLFPVAGIPMDAVHIYMAGQGYSPHLPVFLAQLGVDMATVAHDAITRGPRYRAALEQGMGFDFMTHQGREFILHSGSMAERISPRWERVRQVLSWLNETAEIEMRLAHRERMIKNGMPEWQATARARDRLDFSQGGEISKAVDTLVPYSNVAVQAWRSVLREGAKDPVKAGAKLAWATSAIAGVTALNMQIDPEAWQDIPAYDKIMGIPLIIPSLTFVDAQGNKRVGYVMLRSDNTIAPLHALVVGMMEKAQYGKAPEGLVGKTLATLPSILGNIQIPILDAWYQYTTNTDTYSDAPIYTGIKVPPSLEYKGPAFQQPTSEIWKKLGELTGGSPQRLEKASRALLPNNPYLNGLGVLGNLALETQPPSVRNKTTMDMLAENRSLRRVIKFTHPAYREMNTIETATEQYGGKVKPLYDTVDAYALQYVDGKVSPDQVKAWVKLQPPELQQELANRFKNSAAVEKVMRYFKAGQDTPSRVWWLKLSNSPAEVRAQVFYDRWVSLDTEERKRMESIAGALSRPPNNVGFVSQDFRRHFGKLRNQLGDEQR